jgi:hypothetical protein
LSIRRQKLLLAKPKRSPNRLLKRLLKRLRPDIADEK